MKKTLVAMAALAVVGAASAQSSVTLYGRIDASVRSNTTKDGVGAKLSDVGLEVASGVRTGSRWGMRGTEDLGGGLKAFFDVQNGFNVDTGAAAQGGLLFGRQAFVGLSGGFGSVSLGRQYSSLDTIWGSYDSQGYTGYSAMGWAFNRGVSLDLARINNSIMYNSPTMGGLVVGGMWAPGENGVAGGASAGKLMSLHALYNAGPLSVGASYETVHGSHTAAPLALTAAGTSAVGKTNSTTIGASYDLGVAKIYGMYNTSNNKIVTVKDNGWHIGAAAPIGAMTLNVGYARDKSKSAAGVVGSDNRAWGAELSYPLSKRTYIYGGMVAGVDKAVVAAAALRKQNMYGVGLVHNF